MDAAIDWLSIFVILLFALALLGLCLWLVSVLPKIVSKIVYGRPKTTFSELQAIKKAKAVKTPMTIDGRLTWRTFQSGIAIAYQDGNREKAIDLWRYAPSDATPKSVAQRAANAFHNDDSWLGERMDYNLHVHQFEQFLKDTYAHSPASSDFVLGSKN